VCKKGYTKEEICNVDKHGISNNMTPDTTLKFIKMKKALMAKD
jgi:hypothetical protein